MVRNLAIIFIILVFIHCEKGASLIEQVEPVYNALPTITSSTCNPLYAKMLSQQEAVVLFLSDALYTKDDFENISRQEFNTGLTCGYEVLFFDGTFTWQCPIRPLSGQLIGRKEGDQLYYMTNSFLGYTLSPNFDSKVFAFTPYFRTATNLVTVARTTNFVGAENAFRIFECSTTGLKCNQTVVINVASHLFPVSIHYTGSQWLLVAAESIDNAFFTPGNSYKTYTSADGTSWQGPFSFPSLVPSRDRIMDVSGANQITTATVGSSSQWDNLEINYSCYLSMNSGQTWSLISNAIHAQVLADQQIYAVVKQYEGDKGPVCKLAKSPDGGATWSTEETLFYADRISFYDEMNGIAFTSLGTVQLTNDGGKSWRLILLGFL